MARPFGCAAFPLWQCLASPYLSEPRCPHGCAALLCLGFGFKSLDLGDGESDLSADMQCADFIISTPAAERHT